MARKQTPHMLVDEGRTGRIIARRALRRGLGNPKKRVRDLAELMQEMFFKGVNQGRQLAKLKLQYATAGMEYGESYPVPESVTADLGPVVPAELPTGEGVDAHGGSDFSI